MRILYMSCHEILEYDELRMFSDLGHECYSLGAYTHPGGVEHRKRPPLPQLPYDPHFCELADRYGKQLHMEMLEGMDAVIVMHTPEFIADNALELRDFHQAGGRIIWRSIGQSVPHIEERVAEWRRVLGLEIVRYSPFEKSISRFAGEDAMIRFAKDPADFHKWMGSDPHITPSVVMFAQSLRQRWDHCGYHAWLTASNGHHRMLYGPSNEGTEGDAGLLTYEEQLKALSYSRCMFYHGTYPASYTLSFVEALMAGLPIVCVGEATGNGPQYPEQRTFEACNFLPSDLVTDDMQTANGIILELLNEPDYAQDVSHRMRALGLQHFNVDRISKQWKDLLG